MIHYAASQVDRVAGRGEGGSGKAIRGGANVLEDACVRGDEEINRGTNHVLRQAEMRVYLSKT